MSVSLNFIGRFGNNLFQYCLGRIIAEHHGFALHCTRETTRDIIPPGTSGIIENFSKSLFNLDFNLPGKDIKFPIESYEIDFGNLKSYQNLNFNKILQDNEPRQIRLSGFFQRYEYYLPYQEKIRKWLYCKLEKPPFEINPNDILINIRRGNDFDALNWNLPLTYYGSILSGLENIGQVYILGVGIDDQVFQYFSKYNPVYFSGSVEQQFKFFSHFNRIILSNSTFAWWAGFLSSASEIYAPHCTDNLIFAFTGFKDIDLDLKEPRYRAVSVTSNYIIEKSFNRHTHVINVKYLDGSHNLIELNDINYKVVKWLLKQNELVSMNNLYKHWSGYIDPNSFWKLKKAGLIQ